MMKTKFPNKNMVIKRKLKHQLLSIPTISTKRTITSHRNGTHKRPRHTTYDVGNPGPRFGLLNLCYMFSNIVSLTLSGIVSVIVLITLFDTRLLNTPLYL